MVEHRPSEQRSADPINRQTLAGKFAYYTECNLATLETLKWKKRTPKCELERQASICKDMVQVCRDTAGLRAFVIRERHLPRLMELI